MTFGQSPANQNSLKYTGDQISDVPCVNLPRAPLPSDVNYPIFTLWRNSNKIAVLPDAEGDMWYLTKFYLSGSQVLASWIKVASAAGQVPLQFITDSGTASASANILNVNGGGGATTSGSGNQIIITAAGGPPSALNTLTVDVATAPGGNPVTPAAGNINITGAQVAAGTTANVIRTNTKASAQYTVEVQRSQAVASSTVGDNGVSHFNSNNFNVDGNGFVSINSSSGFFYLNNTINNVTGDGTQYKIAFDSTEFHNGTDITYNAGTATFTVNKSGVYLLGWGLGVLLTSTAFNDLEAYITNNIGGIIYDNPGAHFDGNTFGGLTYFTSVLSTLTATNTFQCNLHVQGGTKIVGVSNPSAGAFTNYLYYMRIA